MGKTAKGMIQIATSIHEVKAEYLQARADALEWSNSKALARVIDFWLALGAPPLSEHDAALPLLRIPAGVHVPVSPSWVRFAGKHPPASLPVRG